MSPTDWTSRICPPDIPPRRPTSPSSSAASYRPAAIPSRRHRPQRWKLHTDGSKVHDAVDSESAAANRDDAFWVLYGSVNPLNQIDNGTTTTLMVDGIGLNEFYQTFGSSSTGTQPVYRAPYDWNLDGSNDGVELTKFYGHYGTVWKFANSAWTRRTAARLGLESTLAARGRPKKSPEKGSRHVPTPFLISLDSLSFS